MRVKVASDLGVSWRWRGWRAARMSGLLTLGLALALGMASCGTAASTGAQRTPSATSTPSITRIPINAAGLGCIMGAQQSPDGKTIAVMASTNGCQTTATASDTTKLALFDAHTGKVERTIDLAQAIGAQEQTHLPAGQTLGSVVVGDDSGYTDWLWSPDSQQLAFLAFGVASDNSGKQVVWQGAALVTTRTGAVRFIAPAGPPTAAPAGPFSSYTPMGAWMLDTHVGTLTWTQVPQAQAYTWQAGGTLSASEPLPASATTTAIQPTAGPIGNVYGASFSEWQGAMVDYTQPDCDPPYFALNFSRPAWSPDGYVLLTPGIQVLARLDAPLPTLATPTPGGYTSNPDCAAQRAQGAQDPQSPIHLARFRPRDAGMASAMALIQKNPAYPVATSPNALHFEWSPDGSRVAVTTTNTPSGPAPRVAIYDCASGKQIYDASITALDPSYAINATDPEANVLGAQWSLDGRSLMVYDGNALIFVSWGAPGK